jgi:hypothetical protein
MAPNNKTMSMFRIDFARTRGIVARQLARDGQ